MQPHAGDALLCVELDMHRQVLDVSDLLHDFIPGRSDDVLQDDNGRLMFRDVIEHAEEGASWRRVQTVSFSWLAGSDARLTALSLSVDALLLRVERRIIDARRSGHPVR